MIFLQYPRKFHVLNPTVPCPCLDFFLSLSSIILKRGKFWRGAEPPSDETMVQRWRSPNKEVFHLIHKENIKKTKEALKNHGSCDFQFRYCETECIKILHWEVAGTVNWKNVILIILEILQNYYGIESREGIETLRTMFRMPHDCLILYYLSLDYFLWYCKTNYSID